MKTPSRWIRLATFGALMFGLVVSPEASAGGRRGGHSGGHPRQAPRMSAVHRASKPAASTHASAPKVSHASTASRSHATASHSSGTQPKASSAVVHNNTSPTIRTSGANASSSTNTYHYGSGNSTRRYQAYGYGRGYRNRYYAGRSGYGRSQGMNRSIVSRLRSVHNTLSRLGHDYHNHRSRAMNHLSMAIRQLSHRSMVSSLSGFRGNNTNLASRRTTQPVSQAHSDQRMAQALRTTQGIAMQMSNQGNYSTSHSRALGHVHRAIREMNTALATR